MAGYGIAVGVLVGALLAFGLLSVVSYKENKMFCEYEMASCKDPWIPIFNM
jgi:hypothetical protein